MSNRRQTKEAAIAASAGAEDKNMESLGGGDHRKNIDLEVKAEIENKAQKKLDESLKKLDEAIGDKLKTDKNFNSFVESNDNILKLVREAAVTALKDKFLLEEVEAYINEMQEGGTTSVEDMYKWRKEIDQTSSANAYALDRNYSQEMRSAVHEILKKVKN